MAHRHELYNAQLRHVEASVAAGNTLAIYPDHPLDIGRTELNEQKLRADLDDNWAVVAEAIQTILRREAYPNPYEALKQLTRTNQKMTEQTIHDFVLTLDVDDNIKNQLLAITPHNYTGI